MYIIWRLCFILNSFLSIIPMLLTEYLWLVQAFSFISSGSCWKALAHMLDPLKPPACRTLRYCWIFRWRWRHGFSWCYQPESCARQLCTDSRSVMCTNTIPSQIQRGKPGYIPCSCDCGGPGLENTCHQKGCHQESPHFHTNNKKEGEVFMTSPRCLLLYSLFSYRIVSAAYHHQVQDHLWCESWWTWFYFLLPQR